MADLKRDVEIILAIKDRTSDGINSALKNVERLKKELNATTKSFKNMTKAGSGQLNESLRTAAALARKAAKEVDGTGKSAKRTAESAKGMMAQFAKFQVLVRKINSAKFAVVGIASAFTLVFKNVSGLNLEMEALRRRFAIIDKTNLAGLGNSFQFVTDEANRLGLPIRQLSQGFSSFVLALQGTQLEGRRGVETFTRLTNAFTALGLSQEDVNGSLRALSQIASKGVVSSEELRQQLGERLPGAFSIAARSLGISTAELNKQLALGTIESADFLEKFSIEVEKTFGDQLQDAINSPRASFQRLGNQLTILRDLLGGIFNKAIQGTVDVLTEVVGIANEFIRTLIRLDKQIRKLDFINDLAGEFVNNFEELQVALGDVQALFRSIFRDTIPASSDGLTNAITKVADDVRIASNTFSDSFKTTIEDFRKSLSSKDATQQQFTNLKQTLKAEEDEIKSSFKKIQEEKTRVDQAIALSPDEDTTIKLKEQSKELTNQLEEQGKALRQIDALQVRLSRVPSTRFAETFQIDEQQQKSFTEFVNEAKKRNIELTQTEEQQLEIRFKQQKEQLRKLVTATNSYGNQKIIASEKNIAALKLLEENYQAELIEIREKANQTAESDARKQLAIANRLARARRRNAEEESALIEQLGDLRAQQAQIQISRGNVDQIVNLEKLRSEKEINEILKKRDQIIQETRIKSQNGDIEGIRSLSAQLLTIEQILQLQKEINALREEDAQKAQDREQRTIGQQAFTNETNELFGAGLLGLGDFDTQQDIRNAKLRETQEIIGVGINGAVDGLSGGLQGLIDGTQSFGQAFQKVGQQMLAMIARLIAQMIVLSIVRRIAGLKGGGEVTDSGFSGIAQTGGPLRTAANGGLISGNPNIRSSNISLGSRNSGLFGNNLLSSLNDDDMLVRTNTNGVTDVRNGGLMPGTPNKRDDKLSVAEVGQYVIPGNKVSKYGPGFFHYLDALAQSGRRIQARAIGGEIMKYANGGGVGRTEPVFLSSGEYVMSKQATQFFGTKFFERIRKGIASPDDLKLDLDSIVNGGRVPGQRNNRDDRLAVGPRDGFVIPNSKVSKFGEKFFEDINTFSLTNRRFANGGMLGKPSYNFTGGVTARMSPTVASMNPVDVNSALGDRAGGATQPDLSLTIVDDNRNERLQAVEEDRTIVSVKNARRRGELLTL